MARGELNPKQLRFVEEYLLCGNATQAAIRAGYSERSAGMHGSRLMKDDEIKRLIAQGQQEHKQVIEERRSTAWLTEEWVLKQLRKNLRLARRHEQISAANKAVQLLGSHRGMWPAKVDPPLTQDVNIRLTFEQILAAKREVMCQREREPLIVEAPQSQPPTTSTRSDG